MKQALGATSAAKRDALVAILLLPAAALQVFFISSLSWWHVPLVRLAVVGALALVSVALLRRAVLRAGEWAQVIVLGLGISWSTAFLLSGLLGRDPLGVLFGFLGCLLISRWLVRVMRRLRSAAYDSGVRWYQGAPTPIPHVRAQILTLSDEVVVESCTVARIDEAGSFLLLPTDTELHPGEYTLEFGGAGMQLKHRAHLNLLWRRSSFRGAGFRFSKLEEVDVTRSIGDWMNRLEGRGYEQMG